ncbi:hypothetical protein BRC89_10690 [Halobacteriales archaeon QS_4_70_19]|nr:MAG: hypothetical protein BRC89_10690 [Halobacteriales archaeon QS_4_70_19]
MDLLSRKYTIQVICVVGALEPVRYGEIERAFDEVSSSTLSTRLEDLTEAGLLDREQYDEIPPRVEYRLTADGASLAGRVGLSGRFRSRRRGASRWRLARTRPSTLRTRSVRRRSTRCWYRWSRRARRPRLRARTPPGCATGRRVRTSERPSPVCPTRAGHGTRPG